MNYAHQRGVIHRDLKPSNIFVDPEGRPKILDFGLARLLDTDLSVATSATEAGKIVGTLAYMSPEQVRGQPDEIDIRSDAYSLGVILYELLTGQRPYNVRGLPLPEVARKICETAPSRPHIINRCLRGDLETIVLKALEKEPERRYQSADALADDIDRYLTNQPILARTPSAIYQLRKMISRHKAPAALTAALFALAATFAVVFGIQATRIAEQRDHARVEARRAEKVSTFLGTTLASFDPLGGPDVPIREVLDKASAGMEVELAGLPETRALLHDTLGRSYRALGLFDQAQYHLETALELRKALYGERHPLFATSLHQIGILADDRLRRVEGNKQLRRAYELRRELLGDEHVDVAESLMAMGRVSQRKGDFVAAERLYHESLAMRRRLLGEHPAVAESLQYLAVMLVEQGRFEEAEPVLIEALDLRRKLLGNGHFDVARTLTDLGEIYFHRADYEKAGGCYREQVRILRKVFKQGNKDLAAALSDLAAVVEIGGNLVEAESLYREAMAMEGRVSGEDHNGLSTNNLAVFLYRQGGYKEAEKLCRKVYRVWHGDAEKPHPAKGYACKNLATVLFELGQHDEAERLWGDAITSWRSLFGTENPALASALIGLGTLMQLRGDYEEAEDLYHESLAIRRARLGEENPKTALSAIYLAGVLHDQGKPGAEAMLLQAIDSLRGKLGSQHYHLSWAISRLARLRMDEGTAVDAEALFREAIEIERQLPRQRHPVLADCLTGLAEVLLARGAPREAEPLLLEALDIQLESYVEGDRRTALTENLLGGCLTAIGRYDEAEPLLLESSAVIEATYGPQHRHAQAARQRITDLYEAWGRPERDAE
jgi:tetratricopeptide (TPR) repeat protein